MPEILTTPVMQSPLHSFGLEARAKSIDASCGVWANEVALHGYISVRGNLADAGFVAAATKALGCPLPTQPCTFSQSASQAALQSGTQPGEVIALWLSPDEWLITTPRANHPALLQGLTQSLHGIRSQIVDNSGGYTQVRVGGAKAREVLSHCTVYDLDHLSAGRIVGTTFGKSSVYLRRVDNGYCLLLRRSFADYIWRYLERAAQPYGFAVAKFAPSRGAGS